MTTETAASNMTYPLSNLIPETLPMAAFDAYADVRDEIIRRNGRKIASVSLGFLSDEELNEIADTYRIDPKFRVGKSLWAGDA